MPRSRIKRGKKNKAGGDQYVAPPPAPAPTPRRRSPGGGEPAAEEPSYIGIGAQAGVSAAREAAHNAKILERLARKRMREERRAARQAELDPRQEAAMHAGADLALNKAGDRAAQQAASAKDLAPLINYRLRALDPAVVRMAPGFAWKYVHRSQAPQEEFDRWMERLNVTVPWVMSKNKTAHHWGSFVAARQYAIASGDKNLMKLVEALDILDPEAQNAVIEELRNPTGVLFENITTGHDPDEIAALRRAGEVLGEKWGLHLYKDEVTGQVGYTVPNTNQGMQTLIAIRTMFPRAASMFSVAGPGWTDELAMDPVETIFKTDATIINHGLQVVNMPVEWIVNQMTEELKFGNAQFADWAYHVNGGKGIDKELRKQAMGYAGTPLKVFNSAFSIFDHAVKKVMAPGLKGMTLLGIKEDSQAYKEMTNATAGLAEIWILHKVSVLGRSYMEGLRSLPEPARAELGITDNMLETNYGGSITGRVTGKAGEILQSPYLHPNRFIEQAVKRLGYNMSPYANNFVRFVEDSKVMRESFDTIDSINTRYSTVEERVSHIRAITKNKVPVELARRLAQAPREAMGRIFIDYHEKTTTASVAAKSTAAAAEEAALLADNHAIAAEDARQRVIAHEQNATTLANAAKSGAEHVEATLPAAELARLAEYPERTVVPKSGEMRGRPDGYTAALRESMHERGYDPTTVPEGGTEPVGRIVVEVERDSGFAIVREGHHRIGVANELGLDVPVDIHFVDRIETRRGVDIDEVAADPALAELGELGAAPMAELERLDFKDAALTSADRAIEAMDEFQEAKIAERDARLTHNAETMRLHDMAGDLTNVPVYEWPKVNRIKAVVWGDAADGLGRAINNIVVKPMRKLGLDPMKTVDELPRYPRFHSPEDPQRPLDWREQNLDTVNQVLRRATVPDDVAGRLAGELALIENTTEFAAWRVRFHQAIDRALPANTPSHIRNAWNGMLERMDQPTSNYGVPVTRYHSDGTPYPSSEPVLPAREGGGALPSAPSEFRGSFNVPDIDMLIEATSVFQRGLRWGRDKPIMSIKIPEGLRRHLGPDAPTRLSALDAVHIPRFAIKFGTLAWKAPILALRIPAMMQRVQMEQALRARLYGGYSGTTFFPGGVHMNMAQLDTFARIIGAERKGMGYELIAEDPRYGKFSRPEDVDLGSIHSQLVDEGGKVVTMNQDMTAYNNRSLAPTDSHYLAAAQQLQRLRGDRFDSAFIEEGLSPERMLERLERDESLRRYVYNDQLPMIKQSRVYKAEMTDAEALTAWLERKRDAIEAQFSRDPEIAEALRTGKIRGNRTIRPKFDRTTAQPLQDMLIEKSEQIDVMNGRIRDLSDSHAKGEATEADIATMRVLEERVRELREEQYYMEQDAGVLAEELYDGTGAIDLNHTQRLAAHLRNRYEGGDYNFPDQLRIQRRYSWEDSHSVYEAYRSFRRIWNKAWYSPYRVLTWADMKGTRGSMYYQMAEQSYRDLIQRGYTDVEARAFAQVRSAERVRDVMYDLSARTSLQKSLQDVFWFGPATQEILYTWLVKIPSRDGGLGYFTIPARFKAAYNVAKAAGLLEKNDQGEDVIPVPSWATLLDMMLPGEQNPKGSKEYMKLTGFNLVTTGVMPSLSTMPAKALAEAGRHYGGVWQSMSETFNQYGADITSTPRQIGLAWEAATGNPFPMEFMSPDYAKRQYDRAMDQALQITMMERIEGGNPPPRRENFEILQDYIDRRDQWLEQLMQDARSRFKGIAWQRLAGSSVTPASVYVDQEEESRYRVYWDEMIDPAGNEEATGTYSEKQKELIDQYIAEHPGSLAYTVSYTTYGEKQRELPYVPVGDQKFFEEFYTGERRVLEPNDYATKLMTIESWRYYLNQKAQAMGGIDQSLTSYLLHGAERTQANVTLNEHWNMFMSANPEANTLMVNSKRRWEERYGIPHETYEQERLSNTIQYLQELSPTFTGEGGLRSKEFTTVLGQLKASLAENGEFGTPTSQLGKDVSWYYDTYLEPYFDETEKLYQNALEKTQRGEYAGDVYAKIQAINDKYSANPVYRHGERVPTPEEMFYGNKPPQEQQRARTNWITKPGTWLTEFQIGKTGLYPEFKGRDEMLKKLNEYDTAMFDYIQQHDVSSASDDYDRIIAQGQKDKARIASQYGREGTKTFQLADASPIERVMHSDFPDQYKGARDILKDTYAAASYMSKSAERNDLSPAGYSEDVQRYKIWLFQQIEAERAHSPQYNKMWAALGRAVPERGFVHREGVPLYDAILFNNFNSQYIPNEVIDAVRSRY